MKLGDTVAIAIDRDRHLVFGTLMKVEDGFAVVVVNGHPYTRQLKRVKPLKDAQCEIKRRKEREKNRYKGAT